MSLAQFWRILWARKFLILAATFFCLAGGVIATLVIAPRWKAEAHVYLNLLKPDPVTGEILGQAARTYVATQIKLIDDYSVTGLAVDKLGWLSDPQLIDQYQRRPQTDTRDFRRWLAEILADRTKADLMDGSNILAITYTGSDPESAKAAANAMMQAYIETSVAFRRSEANRNADWFAGQAQKLKADLTAAQAAETKFEKESGVVMQNDKTDIDTARMAALAAQADAGTDGAGPEAQLAQVDAEIKQASQTLGPNHPQLIALKEKRAAIASMMAQNGSARAASSGASRLAAQKAFIIGNRDKLAKLQLLQADVDLKQDQYSKTLAREAEFRQQAGVVDAGISALDNASAPQSPSFPNKPLIIAGSLGLGLCFGLLMALLIELLDRRVRSPEDLSAALGLPVLAILKPAG